MNEIFVFSLIAALVLVAFIILKFISLSQNLSDAFIEKTKKQMQKIETLSLEKQVLDYDKLLDICLKEKKVLGKTLGERMKKFGQAFVNTQAIWDAHKLRNHLAHELDHQVAEAELKKAVAAFKKEIHIFIKK